MKVYTKRGDQGETSLFGGSRVSKSHARVEAYGAVDELNSLLGWARTESLPREIDRVLGRIQQELLELGAGLAAAESGSQAAPPVGDSHVRRIENDIDRFQKNVAPLRHFILPGGSRAAAALHVARAVCRRAERRAVSLAGREDEHIPENTIPFLNRLADLLFVLARAVNANHGIDEVIWRKDERKDEEELA